MKHHRRGDGLDRELPENKIEELKRLFKGTYEGGPEQLSGFLEELLPRQEKLVIYLYHATMTKDWKQALKNYFIEVAHKNKRLFRSSLDVMYETSDSDILWEVVQHSFKYHQERIEKKFEPVEKVKWRKFIMASNPLEHLSAQIRDANAPMVETAESYLLQQYHGLFKQLFFEVIMQADETFFLREKDLFEKIFKKETNQMQQFMAHHFIRNCPALNRVSDVGYMVYDVLSTDRQAPMKWKEVGVEERERFADWIFGKQLDDFFNQVNTSSERAIYWRKFAPMLRDMVITDHKNTILMYFEKHVIMEVLTVGAVYVYTRETFEEHFQPRINRMRAERERYKNSLWQPEEVKRDSLMNKSLVVQRYGEKGWLTHQGYWQGKFDWWLRNILGWEVDERVLKQKKKARDEG